MPLPSGMLSIVFTDIVGSSELWDRAESAMRSAVEQHDALLDTIVHRHHGQIVKSLGDGMMAVFVDPADAVRSMVDAQRSLAAADWPAAIDELSVRMGVHTGYVDATPGGSDLLGPTVNRAARIADAGHGGQVLASAATRELVGDRVDGVGFVDLGEHQLRGLSYPQRVVQVVADDAHERFPPLRTASSPTNVPEPISDIHGRAHELGQLSDLLDEHRLVTVTGPGGVGKTTLALEIGRRRRREHPAGVWLVELAGLSDGKRVATEWLGAMRQPAMPDRNHLDVLAETLRGQRTLIILDNCEHILADVTEVVATVLESCADVVILATSREPTGLAGERAWPLPTLSLPEAADTDAIERSDAGALFVGRARQADPDFTVDADNAPFVVDLCTRLDGLPLALELACARLRSMSIGDLANRLDDRFNVLTRAGRTRSQQRTLHDTVAWSYELLDEPGQRLLRRLSVFAGGFDLEIAEAMGEPGFLDDLDHLVAQSLVQHLDGRYRMLETIRQFGVERLSELGEYDECCRAQLGWLEELTRSGARQLEGPRQLEWIARFRTEIDNIRAAFAWAMDHEPVRGAAIASSLTRFFWMNSTEIDARRSTDSRSYLSEGYDWATRLLDAGGDAVPVRTRARLQMGVGGMLCVRTGRYREGVDRVDEAMRLFDQIGDERGMGWARFYSAVAGWRLRPVDEAIDRLRDARQRLAAVGDRGGETYCTLVLGYAMVVCDRADEGRPEIEALRNEVDEIGIPTLVAHAADEIVFYDAYQDAVTARTLDEAELAITTFVELNNYACLSHTLGAVATVLGRARDVDSAGLVIGLSAAVRNRLNLVIAPYEDHEHEAFVVLERSLSAADEATAALTDRWRAAIERGLTLEPDEGIELVLDKLRTCEPGQPWLSRT